MRSLSELKEVLADPRAQQMLGLIRNTEGADYNTLFGGGQFDSFADHPRQMKAFKQTDGKMNQSSAAGAYQFLGKTWDGLKKKYGLTDFSPMSQDLGALALLDEKGALDDVLRGDFQSAINRAGGTWASLPSSNYKQPKKSWEYVNQFLGAQGAPQSQETAAISPKNAADVVEGTLAGLAATNPQVDAQDAFAALKREQLQGERDMLALASLDQEADTLRSNAVRGFFGEEPVANTVRKLPPALEDSLSKALFGEA